MERIFFPTATIFLSKFLLPLDHPQNYFLLHLKAKKIEKSKKKKLKNQQNNGKFALSTNF